MADKLPEFPERAKDNGREKAEKLRNNSGKERKPLGDKIGAGLSNVDKKSDKKKVVDVMGMTRGKLGKVDRKAETAELKTKDFVEKEIRGFLRTEKNTAKLADLMNSIDGGIDKLDLSKLRVDTLVKLEDKFPGILLYAFTDIIGAKEKLDFQKWDLYEKPVPGMKLKIDFRGNEEANRKLGIADILPPSVRCVSVIAQGVTRTSERRLGLKGRNKEGTGFFDKSGYMPVYNDDVVVIGGLKEPAKNIDLNYGKQFLKKAVDGSMVLNEESYKEYEKSGEAAKDKEYLNKLAKENPHFSKSKELSDAEIDAIKNRDASEGINKSVLDVALAVARDPYNKGLRGATCCYDWASKIYRMAGAKADAKMVFNYYGKYSGKNCGEKHATESQYDMVKPGDWVFYNNHNTADKYGCHSALFIEWVDKDNKIARLASGSHGTPWKIHTNVTDFKKEPITRLGRPVEA